MKLSVALSLLCKLLTLILLFHGSSSFLIKSFCLTEEEVKQCSYCDGRSERAGNLVMARALREWFHKQIKLTIASGDVRVSESLPTQSIDTGHSCAKTAEARNGRASAQFINDEEALDNLQWEDVDVFKYRFAKGNLPAEVDVSTDVRVYLGQRVMGKCQRIGRKTCSAQGKSKGLNFVAASFQASNYQIVSQDGEDTLAFTLNVSVAGQGVEGSWSAIQDIRSSGCDLEFIGIKFGNIGGMVRNLAGNFFNSINNQLRELRSPKLIAKLEQQLRARIGDEIYVKICDKATGKPRMTGANTRYRAKRSLKTCPRTCQSGYSRVGNSEECHKVVMDTSEAGARRQCPDAQKVEFFRPLFMDKKMYRCIVDF